MNAKIDTLHPKRMNNYDKYFKQATKNSKVSKNLYVLLGIERDGATSLRI